MKVGMHKAKVGDTVLFERKKRVMEAVVLIVRENSVIVEISHEDAKYLQYETNKTVVKHKNYITLNDAATA